MKLLPFDISKIKAGAKCVTEEGECYDYETTKAKGVYKHVFSDQVYKRRLFNDDGLSSFGTVQLSILDESEAEAETPKESFWMLVNKEDRMPTDEFWYGIGKSWCKCSNLELEDQPIRRRVTVPTPESPWIRYEDRKPTKEDGGSRGLLFWSSLSGDGLLDVLAWDHFKGGDLYWMPIPPLPKPKRDFFKEFVEKLEDSAGEQLWNLLSADEKEKIQDRWEAENL